MLDPIKNLVYVITSIGYDASATSIALQSGGGAKLPNPAVDGAFNLVWYNHTDYKNPADDPNVEIIRVTGKSGENLTITRAQESTTASNKNTTGKTYRLILGMTAKMITDIQTALNSKENSIVPSVDIYLDGNRTDSYTEDGTINRPFKTIAHALTLSPTTPITIHLAPATYTETTDLTLPNVPIVIYGNGATISASGHTITFQNPNSARYNLFTTANVVYSNYATGARNMVIGGSITGNITVNAYCEFIQCQLNGGTITIGSTGQLFVQTCTPTSKFVQNGGFLGFQNVNLNTSYAGYLITSTAGQLSVNSSFITNTSSNAAAGCISCNNGATTLPNSVANCILSTLGQGYALYAGTAATIYSKNYIVAANTVIGSALAGVNTDITGPGNIIAMGSDATGDIYYRAATGILTRRAIGTSAQALMGGTTPTWGTPWKDANNNIAANNFLSDYATTATAGGSTTLTVASKFQQFFTGSSNQTVIMPVTSTLALGQSYQIVNNSSGIVTVKSSGNNTILEIPANSTCYITCILTSGTTETSWSYSYIKNIPGGGGVGDHSCSVGLSGQYTLSSNYYLIPWSSEEFDTDNMHDNVTNNTRITVPSSGKYLVNLFVDTVDSGNNYGFVLQKNGSDFFNPFVQNVYSSTSHVISNSAIVSLSANDYLTILAGASNNGRIGGSTKFQVIKLA